MSFVELSKLWEDDDGMLQVELSASNGRLTACQDFYAYPETLAGLGEKLLSYFPKNGHGEVAFEYGNEDGKVYSHVRLAAFYVSAGSIGLHVRTHNNREGLEKAICEFCINTTLQSINDLGRKITKWAAGNEKTLRIELSHA